MRIESASADATGATAALSPAAAGRKPADVSPQVARQAVTWLVELQAAAPDSPVRQDFERWLRADPAHERAWRHIEAINARLSGLASPLGSSLARASLTPAGSNRRRRAIKTLVLLLFAGGTLLAARDRAPWQPWLADLRTRSGERRSLVLADGTRLALNSDSAVDLAFTADSRRLRLLRGEILIDTGKDEGAARPRPFVVATRHGELVPRGTRFSVRLLDAHTRLEVHEGAVEIRPREAPERRFVVKAGQRVDFTADATGEPAAADENRTAWRDGMLVASRMRLADFLAELDRHRPGRLNCAPEVAGLRLSGTYPLDDPERILHALPATLPVEIHYFTRYWATVRAARRGG